MPTENFLTYGYQTGEPDSQLWTMLDGHLPGTRFRGWGFTDIEEVDRATSYTRYMVKRAGRWFYAHSDGTSCYVSLATSFKAESGAEAWAQHQHDQLVRIYNALLESLEEQRDAILTAREKINRNRGSV